MVYHLLVTYVDCQNPKNFKLLKSSRDSYIYKRLITIG